MPLRTGLGVAALQRGNRVDIASEPIWPHCALELSRENKDQTLSGVSRRLDGHPADLPVPGHSELALLATKVAARRYHALSLVFSICIVEVP